MLEDRQTLGVLKNGEGADATFRIQMFKFVGGSYTDVFLHCNVQICHGGRGACRPVSQPEAGSDTLGAGGRRAFLASEVTASSALSAELFL